MKKNFIILAAACSILTLLSGCRKDGLSHQNTLNKDNYETIHLVMNDDRTPADQELVEEAVNKITREKLQVNVDLETIAPSGYASEYNLFLSENPQADLVAMIPGSEVMKSLVSMDMLLPLEDLVSTHGRDLEPVLGNTLKTGEYHGHLYGIPSIRQSGSRYGVILQKELADKYQVDVAKLKTWDDLDEIFALIHKNEPDTPVLAPIDRDYGLTSYLVNTDNLGGTSSGVLLNGGLKDLKVVNYFESQEYLQALHKIREWYTKGYIDQDVLFQQESYRDPTSQDHVFARFNLLILEDNLEDQSVPKLSVPLTECIATTSVAQRVLWGIPASSKNPEKAAQLLNLMYQDKDIVNLLQYGIEGIHYTIQEDGTMLHEMHTKESSRYFRRYDQAGNLDLLLTAQNLGTDFEQKRQELEGSTRYSKAYGFIFETTYVESELSAIQSVLDTYQLPLELGTVDPDTELPIMQEKLREAGISRVILEKQRQLDEWASRQRKSKKGQKK